MSTIANQSQSVKDAIGALKFRLNQLLPLYLEAALKNLSCIYQYPSSKDYGHYLDAKKKYAMIAHLIHLLETSAAPEQILATVPSI